MDELDFILMERLEEAERIDRFQSYLNFIFLKCSLDDQLFNLVNYYINSREWDKMVAAKEIILDNTEKSMHRRWLERLKKEGVDKWSNLKAKQ